MLKRIAALCLLAVLLAGCARLSAVPDGKEAAPPPATETAPPSTVPIPQEPLPSAEAEPELHSGLNADGSFTAGTLILGDSLTHMLITDYLEPQGLLGEASYAARFGAQADHFFDPEYVMSADGPAPCVYSPEFEGMGFAEAAEAMGERATAIYLMWGTNFIPYGSAQDYIEIVDHLLSACPNATVHMQLIPPGELPYALVNEWITQAWSHFEEMGESRGLLVDTCTAIGADTQVDGIHLNDEGNRRWHAALLDHGAQRGLEP